ncbi:MAG: hypothetical protein MUC63_10890, partial [Planctomycetes bacterium]|nr:hypothetical protein [Planctomycetota bacterium]
MPKPLEDPFKKTALSAGLVSASDFGRAEEELRKDPRGRTLVQVLLDLVPHEQAEREAVRDLVV